MLDIRKGSHSVHQLHVHIVWSTKYRYEVLKEDVQIRCRELIRQTCDTLDIQISKGVVSKDHIHLHLSYPPKLNANYIFSKVLNFGKDIGLILWSSSTLIPLVEKSKNWLAETLAVFGRVSLFYYLLHIPLIHISALFFFDIAIL